MSYATVDDAVRCIKTLGCGALLAKLTSRTPIGRSQFTQQIGCSSGCHGVVIRLWTEPFLSVSGRRRSSSRQWPMPCCGRSGGGMSFMPCTIWTISLHLAPRIPRNVAGHCRRAFGCAIVGVSLLPRTS